MVLLAQLNLSEVPSIDEVPTTGILQFYLSVHDGAMGLDLDDPTKGENFRVVYHEMLVYDESQLLSDFSFIGEWEEGDLPGGSEASMNFSVQQEVVSPPDFRFDPLTNHQIDVQLDDDEMWDALDKITAIGHKIGGYPYFTQMDPREDHYENHTVLLFQMDTDDELEIMWGDSGVGNFFITPEDLKNRNFSNVLFTWDCC